MYKTLYLQGNPNFEYQKRKGVWFRRPIGTKDVWSKPDANGVKVLNEVFANKPAIFFYSKNVFIGGVVLLGIVGYYIYSSKKTPNRQLI